MKKVALCLTGLASGMNDKQGGLPVSFKDEASLYQKNFIQINQADVFIHTWSADAQVQLDEAYRPVAALYEQKKMLRRPSVAQYLKYFINQLQGRSIELYRLNNIYSRWYSFKQVVDLMRVHERTTGIKYSHVLVSRFDMSLLKEWCCLDWDDDRFYVANWLGYKDRLGNPLKEAHYVSGDTFFEYRRGFPSDSEGLLDFWFMANSDVMECFSQLYDHLDDYLKETGKSNHQLALKRLKDMNLLSQLSWRLDSYKDFWLTRWL